MYAQKVEGTLAHRRITMYDMTKYNLLILYGTFTTKIIYLRRFHNNIMLDALVEIHVSNLKQ